MKNLKLSLLIGFITGLMILAALGIGRFSAFRPVNAGLMDNYRLAIGQLAHIQVEGEYNNAELVSPTGEKINLRTEKAILVPAELAEKYVVHVMGDKTWMIISVTSYNRSYYWASALEDASGTIFKAGNSAITSYHWD